MTWRQLRVLIQHLPPESATMTALRNAMTPEEYEAQARKGRPEEGQWSMTEQLLAGITDSLHQLEYILVVTNGDGKGRKPKRPEPMRRPGVAPKQTGGLTDRGAETLFRLINGGSAA
ncbi:hypothetical protein OOK39_02015 [Streptomyces sp. NBC_00264]|uniref:hypothetical protein n=1 Tax=unclassified Streptomyces TaxID=2593676 RepID=UPI002258DBB6|nr:MULTISPECIES: hypothetical protein [unclassified Streptomyces]MCX5158077.1 hypothetical protein [Streptomyces sp. NBC_00305]MCX5216600.1 hypothetical protein [Streptomyces sp. NBC_00264]